METLITLYMDFTASELREVYGYSLGEDEPLPEASEAARFVRKKVLRIADRESR